MNWCVVYPGKIWMLLRVADHLYPSFYRTGGDGAWKGRALLGWYCRIAVLTQGAVAVGWRQLHLGCPPQVCRFLLRAGLVAKAVDLVVLG